MKSWTRAAVLIALCVGVVAAERAAYYGMRSILPIHLMSDTSSASEAMKQLGYVTAFGALTPIVGGALAILLRAPLTAAAGVVIMLFGYVMLPFSDGPFVASLGIGIIALGGGLLKPTLYGLCADELSHRHSYLRAAAFVTMYGAVNLSALLSTTSAGALSAATDTKPVLIGAAALIVLAFLLTVAVAIVDYALRDKRPEPEAGDPPGRRAALLAAGLMILAVPYGLALSLTGDFWEALSSAGAPATRIGALLKLNPLVVVLCDAVLLAALVILHFLRARFSPLYLGGAGLCIVGLGATPYLLAVSMGSPSELTVSVALALMAVGEAVAGPVLFSVAVGHLPQRFASLGAGVWLAAASVPSFIVHAALSSSLGARTVLFALCAGAALLSGLVLLGVTHLIVRFMQSPEGKQNLAAGGTLISAK